MLKVDTNRKALVRGYYVFSQWRAGCISMEKALDPNCIEVSVAYTPWHRHDDDPLAVIRELNAIVRCYSRFETHEGGMMGLEYKEYRK